MLTLPPDDLLPVLVADLADDEAKGVLDAAAFTGSTVWVPLETAPVSAAEHMLEVHTPGISEPFYYVAIALGPPTEDGFPLRLSPMDEEIDIASLAPNLEMPPAPRVPDLNFDGRSSQPGIGAEVVRGKRAQTNITLSEGHTKDLSHVGPLPTDDSKDSKLGRALAGGKLLIEQMIGRGGVGAVYKARHRELMMPVAVKVLHESFQSDIDFARRFYAEALGASRLDHPNITRVLDFGQEPDGSLYFAMEFLDGIELRALLDKEKTFTAKRIAEIMMQVCAGLAHAHARGMVHRDVKPENLVIVKGHDDDGKEIDVVKVCDFGIALHRAAESPVAGAVAGTPEYMSPEQCRADELDARSDVYAVGIILYEMATGKLPFEAEHVVGILNKHQFSPHALPSKVNPNVDPTLERIINKALEKEAPDRQQSMRQLRAELRELLDPVVQSPATPSVREVPAATGGDELELMAPQRGLGTRRQDDNSDWLDRSAGYPESRPTPQRGVPAAQVPGATGDTGDQLAPKTLAWLARLVKTTDATAFAQGTQQLEGPLRTLASRGDVEPLWQVASTMHGISTEGNGAVGTRAWSAAKLLRIFEDPALLTQVAEQHLAGRQELREKARRLLVNGGVAGAYGLYGARVKHASNAQIRQPFVTMLKDFGPKAWPVVRASLEKIVATPDPNPATFDLAEDLLLCVPIVGDENAGHTVLKFLRWTHSGVCRAATAAIVKLWADRAKPVLVAMVQSKDDVIRVAGIAGLRQLGAIDEHLIPRLQAILTRRVPAGEEVRGAAAVALSHASATARVPAVELLKQLLQPSHDDPPQSSKQDAVIVAIARSLLKIGGANYQRVIEQRAATSQEPLRGQLRGLLTQA